MPLEVKAIGGRFYLYEVQYSWDRKEGRSRKQTLRYLGPCDPGGKLLRRPKIAVESLRAIEPVGALAALYAQAVDLGVVRVAEETLGLSPRASRLLLALAIDAATGPRPPGTLETWVARGPLSWWEPSLRGEPLGPGLTELRERLRPRAQAEGSSPRATLEEGLTRAWTSRALAREPTGAYVEVVPHDRDPAVGPGRTPLTFGVALSRESLLPIWVRPGMGMEGDHDLPSHLGGFQGSLPKGTALVEVLPAPPAEAPLGAVVQAGLHVVGTLHGPSKEAWEVTGREAAILARGPPIPVRDPRGASLLAYDFEARLLGHRLRVGVIEDLAWKERERWERAALLTEWAGPVPDAVRAELSRELVGVLSPARGRRGGRIDPEKVREAQERDGRWVVFSTDLRMDVPTMLRLLDRRRVLQRVVPGPSAAVEPWRLQYGAETLWELGAAVGFLSALLWGWAERRLRLEQEEEPFERILDRLGRVSSVGWSSKGEAMSWATPLDPGEEKLLGVLGGFSYLPR